MVVRISSTVDALSEDGVEVCLRVELGDLEVCPLFSPALGVENFSLLPHLLGVAFFVVADGALRCIIGAPFCYVLLF